MITERFESMSPDGRLRLYRQNDGDIVIEVFEESRYDTAPQKSATIEFCTPGNGGGGSSNTYRALVQLMGAMATDNLDPFQQHRRGSSIDEAEQHTIRQWANECKQAREEMEPPTQPAAPAAGQEDEK